MGVDFVNGLASQAVKVALLISAPMLIGSLLIGILISIFQAVTQINEQTLVFIPKILIIVLSLIIFSPWIADAITTFTTDLYVSIPDIIAGR